MSRGNSKGTSKIFLTLADMLCINLVIWKFANTFHQGDENKSDAFLFIIDFVRDCLLY